MIKENRVIYIADDGKEFLKEQECINYEKFKEVDSWYRGFLARVYNDVDNVEGFISVLEDYGDELKEFFKGSV